MSSYASDTIAFVLIFIMVLSISVTYAKANSFHLPYITRDIINIGEMAASMQGDVVATYNIDSEPVIGKIEGKKLTVIRERGATSRYFQLPQKVSLEAEFGEETFEKLSIVKKDQLRLEPVGTDSSPIKKLYDVPCADSDLVLELIDATSRSQLEFGKEPLTETAVFIDVLNNEGDALIISFDTKFEPFVCQIQKALPHIPIHKNELGNTEGMEILFSSQSIFERTGNIVFEVLQRG